jgi:adenosine kinase
VKRNILLAKGRKMDIVVTGSIAFDYLMTFPGYFREQLLPEQLEKISLSFLVDSMIKQRGGTAPNIAYNLALLGGHPRLAATAGEDFTEYRAWLESKGIDTSNVKVIPGENTASFFANTDRSNAQIASFYPGAMAHASEISLTDLKGGVPDLVVISPNDPNAMIQYAEECRNSGIPYLYDPSQQVVRYQGAELRSGVESAQSVFLNDYEFSLLKKKTGMTLEEILSRIQFLVVTCGGNGADVYTKDTQVHIPVVPPERILDPTGVGDAFRGGFLTGYRMGWNWQICGEMGALAATYCLEQRGTLNHSYTTFEFVQRFRQYFVDGGLLDRLTTHNLEEANG